jgi:hypothetical protein
MPKATIVHHPRSGQNWGASRNGTAAEPADVRDRASKETTKEIEAANADSPWILAEMGRGA